MKRANWLVLPALMSVVVPSAMSLMAGDAGGKGHKCTMTVEACLTSMSSDIKAHGYVGIETDKDEATGAISVKRVVPGSPAEAAGLQAGDILLGMNGIKFGDEKNEAALMAAKKSMKVGSQLIYLVRRGGYDKKVAVTLGQVPEEVLAQRVGYHMLEHVNTEVAKN